MPISLVGTVGDSAASGADVTLTLPTLLPGDVVYIAGGHSLTTAEAGVSTSGYTELVDFLNGTVYRFTVSRKVMGATPDTTAVGIGSGDAADAVSYVAICLRGVNETPEDATTTTATGSSTNPDGPSIVTVTRGVWVLAFAGSSVNDASIVAPSGYGNQVNTNVNDTRDSTVAGATKLVAAPATEDPATWTTWATGAWCCATVAVREKANPMPMTNVNIAVQQAANF